MSRIRLFIEVEICDALMWGEGGPDTDALRWFERDVLSDVYLYSNDIGDEIGKSRVLAMDRLKRKPTPVPKTMKRLRDAARGGDDGK